MRVQEDKKMIRGRKLTAFVVALAMVLAGIVMFDPVSAASKPGKVKKLTATAVSYNAVKLKWKKARNTSKYCVYYSAGSKYKLAAKTKKTSYTIKKLKGNKIYKIKIRAVKGKKKGRFSKAVKTKTLCKVTFVYKSQNRKTQKTIKGVKRGGNVTAPSVKGYTYKGNYYKFKNWDKSLKNIKGNTTITAKYKNTGNNPFGTDDWYWAEDNNWYKALMSGNKEIINECLNQMNESYCASDNKDDPKMIAAALKWTWITIEKNGSNQSLLPFANETCKGTFGTTFNKIKNKYNITSKTLDVKIAALTAIGICNEYDYGDDFNKKQLVCGGYSSCYQYCMNRFGVPCYRVSTETDHCWAPHAWNIVKINDKYYHVDVTEMDMKTDYDGKIVQRYYMCYKGNFLKSTKYMIEADESASDFMPGDLATHYLNPKLPIQCTDTSYDNYNWSKEYENVF